MPRFPSARNRGRDEARVTPITFATAKTAAPRRILAAAPSNLLAPLAESRSVERGLDDLCECVPGPVQPRFHRTEVAVRDLRDLLVRLPLQLAQHEDLPMMLGQLGDGLLNEMPEMTLPEEIVGTRGRILELQRALLVLPVVLNCLEQHERIARPIAQLVLGQVRGNGVDPCRELLRPVEAMDVPVDPDEDLLNEILRLFPIADRAVDEVQQPRLIALDELLKRPLLASEKRRHDCAVVLRPKSLSNCRACQRLLDCELSHCMPPLMLHQGSIRQNRIDLGSSATV